MLKSRTDRFALYATAWLIALTLLSGSTLSVISVGDGSRLFVEERELEVDDDRFDVDGLDLDFASVLDCVFAIDSDAALVVLYRSPTPWIAKLSNFQRGPPA